MNFKYMQDNWAIKLLTALCLVIPLAFSARTFDHFGIPKQVIFNMGCGLLLLLLLFNFRKLRVLPKYLQYALLFFFITQVYQTIRVQNPINAILGAYGQSESFVAQCGFMILFLSGFLFIKRESEFASLSLVLIISIYFTGIFGIYQYYLNDPISRTPITRIKSLFGDPNSFGVFLVLVLVLAFYEFQRKKNSWRHLFAGGGIYIGSTVLVLTFSRAAWSGFLISLILYIFGMLFHFRKHKKPMADFKFLITELVVIIAIGILSAQILTFFQPKSHTDYDIKARISSIVNGNDSGRGLLWQAALKIFKSAPLLGYGINSFQDNFHYFQTENAVNFWGPDRDLEQTHNELLHYLATQGLLGLGAYLALLLTILMAVKPLKLIAAPDYPDGPPPAMFIAISSAIGGYLVFIQFAYPLIHYSFLFWIYLGIVTRMGIPSQTPYPESFPKFRLERWKFAVVIMMILGWGWMQVNTYAADVSYRKAFYQARYHHFPVSLAYYQKTISLTPWNDYYKYRYAITLNRAAQWEIKKNANTVLARQYFFEARAILLDLMKKNPRRYQYSFLFGQILETKHQYSEAKSYYQTAHSLYPKNYKIIFRLAKVEALMGHPEKAKSVFKNGAEIYPGYMREMAQKEALPF